MKTLTTLTLLTLTAATSLALNPSLPVVRLDEAGAVVERRQELPNRYRSHVNYRRAEPATWTADGWRNFTTTSVTNTQTIPIPEPIQQVAAAYKATMESIYGEGAATNTALTRAAVAIDLSLNESITAEVGLRLSTWYEILDGFWGRGEVWSFPFGESEYEVQSVTEILEVIEP